MTKRICYFLGTHGDWGGASRVLFHVIRSLDRTKFTPVVILTSKGPGSDELEHLGIEHYIRPTHDISSAKPLNIGYVFVSMLFFLRYKIDIVHENYGCLGWRPPELIAARLMGIPVVEHLHVPVQNPNTVFRSAHAIIAVSEYVAKNTLEARVPFDIVYNAVELDRYLGVDMRAELGIATSAVIVTFIGQVRRIKGVELFLEAARRLAGSNVNFLLAGGIRPEQSDSYSEHELDGLIGDIPNVKYLGYVRDIKNIYATADIVVVPSLWDEPFGLVIIEAWANSKAVVASRVGGIPEIIEHGKSGFLFERGNVDQLTDSLGRLIADPGLRSTIGQNGRQVVEREFTTAPVRKIEAIYDRFFIGTA